MKDFYPANSDVKRTSKVVTVKELVEQGISKVTVDNGALKVDEIDLPVGPVPVAEFDGVKYYHKSEPVDLVNLKGNVKIISEEINGASLYGADSMGGQQVRLYILTGSTQILKTVYSYNPSQVNYVSHAFTIVQQQSEVTDDTKICLPGCTAYYGFLSEDGKTFISYYNLEGDGPVEVKPVTKITDGKTEVEIHDARLDSVQSGTIVDALGLNGDGALVKGAISGGTKLYRHEMEFTDGGSNKHKLIIISSDNTLLTDLDSIKAKNDKIISIAHIPFTGSFNVSNAQKVLYIGTGFVYALSYTNNALSYNITVPVSWDDDIVTEL